MRRDNESYLRLAEKWQDIGRKLARIIKKVCYNNYKECYN